MRLLRKTEAKKACEGKKTPNEAATTKTVNIMRRQFFNVDGEEQFRGETMAVEMEGDREAPATLPVWGAPQGASKGQGPLCSLLLPHEANLSNSPPGCSQTQVPQKLSKRPRITNTERNSREPLSTPACHYIGDTCQRAQEDGERKKHELDGDVTHRDAESIS